MTRKHQATEQLSFEDALARVQRIDSFTRKLIARLGRIRPLAQGAKIVEIGSAQGACLITLTKLGFAAIGIEPWRAAREVALRLAEHQQCVLDIREGFAESLPLEDKSCDAVIAKNVFEHVLDADASFREVFRVLKPGGVFWFSAASSVCPRQKEIDGFPLFPWYPDALKRRIMSWGKRKKPHLVGHTETPAINWFTPRKARRMLRQVGFGDIYDRWDLRLSSEGGGVYRLALGSIRSCSLGKLLADLFCEGCAYATVRPQPTGEQ